MRIPRSSETKISKKSELKRLEDELAWEIAFTMPRWAYNRQEWTDFLLKKSKIRKQISKIKKKLSGS